MGRLDANLGDWPRRCQQTCGAELDRRGGHARAGRRQQAAGDHRRSSGQGWALVRRASHGADQRGNVPPGAASVGRKTHVSQIVTSREVRSADTRRNLTGYFTLAPAPGQTRAEPVDGPPPLTASRLADPGGQLPGPASGLRHATYRSQGAGPSRRPGRARASRRLRRRCADVNHVLVYAGR